MVPCGDGLQHQGKSQSFAMDKDLGSTGELATVTEVARHRYSTRRLDR
jgi:hypothetical protein